MLAVSITAGQVKVIDVARPQVEEPTDAVLMVTSAAIGPWETEIARSGDSSLVTPGAQFAGTVVETGSDVSKVRIDDLVVATASAALPGGRVTRFGEDVLAGGHAEYVRVPMADRHLVKTVPGAEERSVFAGGEAALGIRAATSALSKAGDGPILALGCDTAVLAAIAWIGSKRGKSAETYAARASGARLAAAGFLGATEKSEDEVAEVEASAIITSVSTGDELAGVPVFSTRIEDSKKSAAWPTLDEVKAAEAAVRLRQIDLTMVVSTVLPLEEAVDGYKLAVEEPPGRRAVLLKP